MTLKAASFTAVATTGIFDDAAETDAVRIRTITPSSGPTTGGTTVVIVGENFGASGNTVTIDGNSATITTESATSITVTTPAGSAGVVDVAVTNAVGDIDTYEGSFTYITSTAPGDGQPLNRTTGLTITGAYTLTTGPDLIANTAYTITTAFECGNATQASGTVMFLSTTESNPNGITCATWDSFTDSNSTTWYLRYFRGAITNNVTFAAGLVVFDIRIYSSQISDVLLTHYVKDMEENRGRRYLP